MSEIEKKVASGICILLTLGIIGVLIWLVVGHSSKDNFCGACQNIGLQVGTNKKLLHKLYNSGELTENSELVRGDKWKIGPYVGSVYHPYQAKGRNTCI